MTLFSDILSIPSNPEDIFTLLNPIGHGAFGYVYKAIHNQSKKIYAIKIINYFKESINFLENKKHINNINFCYQTVQQETSLMKKVSSSNFILKYYGSYFSRKTNSLWLIIEYCSYGSTIDLMLATNRLYSEIEVATIIKMVLQGLIIIHDKKLIHRDIKGANILLSEDGYAKLGDFGVGTKLLLKENFRSSIKGSPYWMSPQVIQKENYDSKTDIWSLGITCIELTQGEPPFSELNPNEVMDIIGNKKFTFNDFFMGKKSNYSKEFINFISKCLEINPQNRGSAKELIRHSFIVKYAKDNIFMKKLLKKYEKDIDNYRKEFEENELKLKFGFNFDNNCYCNNIFMNNNSKQIINKELNLNLNESFFNFSKIINNDNDSNNTNDIKKEKSKVLNKICPLNTNKEKIYRKISPKNSKKMNNSLRINKTKNNLNVNILNFNKSIIRNNSFIISPKIKSKISKSRNTKLENNFYCSNNNTNNKCQRINFGLSIKNSVNKDISNKTVYTKKIIINQGKLGKSLDKYYKLNSYKKIKTINSNINTDMNTNNTNNNNNSFMLNSTKKKINLKMKVTYKTNINLDQFLDNKKPELNIFEDTVYNENIDESNDDDYIINKINNYTINKGVYLINKKNNINNNDFDTIHSYSIIDSKDTFISIHSSKVNLNEQNKKYY